MTTRARRLLVAVLSGVAGRAVALVAPLVVMAPMLDHLGSVLFGVWLTAVALAAMSAFLDFGIGNAALTRLSDAFGRNDLRAARRMLAEAYALLLSITGAGLVLLACGAFWASRLADPAKVAVVSVVLAALLLSFPLSIIGRLLQARQAFVQSQLATAAGPLLAMVGCLAGIELGVAPVGAVALYALASPLVLLVWTVGYFLAVPAHRPAFGGVKTASMQELLSLGGAFFTLSIFTLIGMNVDNVILAAVAGPEVVAEYGVPAKLGSILMMIVGTVFMPLWPMFGNALAQNDRGWLRVTTLRMSLGGASVVLAVGLTLTLLADPLMDIWMGRAFADQQLIILGWTVAATVIALTAPYNMVLNASGMARPQILPWAAFVAISVGAKFALLGADTAWWAPWITAGVYAVTIAPWMMRRAVLRLRETGTKPETEAS